MGLKVGGNINNPYEANMDTDGTTDHIDMPMPEVFKEFLDTPHPSPEPATTPAAATCGAGGCCPAEPPLIAKKLVTHGDAMFAAKAAFVLGAVTGLLLANFLRRKAVNGE